MRRARLRVLVGLLAVTALVVLRAALWRPLAVAGTPPADGFTRVPGVVHVHTSHSDGGGTPEEVVAAARATGLRFVVITDHNNLDAKPVEGYRDGVLVIVGTEISTTAGHLLGLGLSDPVFRFSGDAADALDDVRDLGGSAWAAHTMSQRQDLAWSGWDLPGPWGVEVLNGDSQWREAGWGSLLKTLALYPANPRYALLGSLTSPQETLARWDQLLSRRDVAGNLGADAHSRVAISGRLQPRFPSYESVFALAKTFVLLEKPLSGDAATDTVAVLEALRRGRAYVGVDALAPAAGFSFVARAEAGRWSMGDTLPFSARPRLEAGGLLARGARVTLLRDGAAAASGGGPITLPVPGPGVYRVEVRLPGWEVPWILSNPIYVFDEAAAAERAVRGAWPAPATAPEALEILDGFDGSTRFAPEFDTSSSLDAAVLAPGEGPEGAGAALMGFRLGTPVPSRPHVWCALADRTSRDLSGRKGLVFSIKGDREYRIWVQVRDANLASADEGTEWWFASVKTAPEWRRVAVPFSRLRSFNGKSDGRLDLDEVRGLIFVLDEASVKPGTAGRIWLAGLGVY